MQAARYLRDFIDAGTSRGSHIPVQNLIQARDKRGALSVAELLQILELPADRWQVRRVRNAEQVPIGGAELHRNQETPVVDRHLTGASYCGEAIYSGDDWINARPFVRHHLLKCDGKAEIMVDEVNYWPMLFPLKARFLLVPEHDLSGDDKGHLELVQKMGGVFHNWLRPQDLTALAKPPRGGHAAVINRVLKHQIMNWGLSDAVVALGSMRVYLNHAMDLAFDQVRGKGDPETDNFVVMAESLGSFVVLDAMDSKPAVADVMARTDYVYFLANQVALLELARIQGVPTVISPKGEGEYPDLVEATGPATVRPSPYAMLKRWGQQSHNLINHPRQIIAFSDPSDVLTYRVPPIDGVTVVNLYDRNTPRWLGLLAAFGRAHLGHLENKAVWNVLMR